MWFLLLLCNHGLHLCWVIELCLSLREFTQARLELININAVWNHCWSVLLYLVINSTKNVNVLENLSLFQCQLSQPACFNRFFFWGGGQGGGLIGWLATPILEEPSIKQILKDCEHYGRNKLRQTLWTDASFTLYTLYTLDYRYFQILCYKKRHARN